MFDFALYLLTDVGLPRSFKLEQRYVTKRPNVLVICLENVFCLPSPFCIVPAGEFLVIFIFHK